MFWWHSSYIGGTQAFLVSNINVLVANIIILVALKLFWWQYVWNGMYYIHIQNRESDYSVSIDALEALSVEIAQSKGMQCEEPCWPNQQPAPRVGNTRKHFFDTSKRHQTRNKRLIEKEIADLNESLRQNFCEYS